MRKSKAERDAMLRMYQKSPTEKIARKFGVTEKYLRKLAYNNGIKTPNASHVLPEVRAEIIRLWPTMTLDALARKFKLKETTVKSVYYKEINRKKIYYVPKDQYDPETYEHPIPSGIITENIYAWILGYELT